MNAKQSEQQSSSFICTSFYFYLFLSSFNKSKSLICFYGLIVPDSRFFLYLGRCLFSSAHACFLYGNALILVSGY